MLSQKVLFIICSGKIALGTCSAAQRFTVLNLLQVVESACDATVAVGVESIETDAGSTVTARVDFGSVENLIFISINNSRSNIGIGIHEIGVGISGIIGTLQVTVAELVFSEY